MVYNNINIVFIWIMTTLLFIPCLTTMFGLYHCETFYEVSDDYNVTGNYTTYKGISSAPQLSVYFLYNILVLVSYSYNLFNYWISFNNYFFINWYKITSS